jgi:hypothetical protein
LQVTERKYAADSPITEKTLPEILSQLRFSAIVVASKEIGVELNAVYGRVIRLACWTKSLHKER